MIPPEFAIGDLHDDLGGLGTYSDDSIGAGGTENNFFGGGAIGIAMLFHKTYIGICRILLPGDDTRIFH